MILSAAPAASPGLVPKRGDILQTAVGRKTERTWLVVSIRPLRWRTSPQRYKVAAYRWWELEPHMRNLLFRHAERHGGQVVFAVGRTPRPKRKIRFEDELRAGLARRKGTAK